MTMNRPMLVYLGVFGVFCVGIWVVLAMGSGHLVAPPDLSGPWRLVDQTGGGKPGFVIHQSGRFIQLNFDQGPKLDLILQPTNPSSSMQSVPGMTLIGDGWEITATPGLEHDATEFAFKPPATEDQSLAGQWEYERGEKPAGNNHASATAPAVNHAR